MTDEETQSYFWTLNENNKVETMLSSKEDLAAMFEYFLNHSNAFKLIYFKKELKNLEGIDQLIKVP